mgnify:CR=1 FL=1
MRAWGREGGRASGFGGRPTPSREGEQEAACVDAVEPGRRPPKATPCKFRRNVLCSRAIPAWRGAPRANRRLELRLLETIDTELDDLRWRVGRHGRQFTHARVARAFLWTVLCDRPLAWLDTTSGRLPSLFTGPRAFPTSSTVSRRLRDPLLHWLLEDLLYGLRFSAAEPDYFVLDSKALPVSPYSKDAHATTGHGRCETQRGYKLHLLTDNRQRVWSWQVLPMHVDEVDALRLLLSRVADRRGARMSGVILTDTGYALASREFADAHGFTLVCPFDRNARDPVEARWQKGDHVRRDSIERFFGNLSTFGGGLQGLPSWVRTLHRVRLWVLGKLIINAARLQLLRTPGRTHTLDRPRARVPAPPPPVPPPVIPDPSAGSPASP